MPQSPIAQTLRMLHAQSPYTAVAYVPTLSGVTLGALCTTPSELWQRILHQQRRDLGAVALSILVGSFVQLFAWPVLHGSASCLVVTQRVLTLAPETTAVRYQAGYPQVLEVASPRVYALQGDSADANPDWQVVPDMSALYQLLHQQWVAFFGPLVSWLTDTTAVPAKSLWMHIADVGAGAMVQAMDRHGGSTQHQVQSTVAEMFGDTTSPLFCRQPVVIGMPGARREHLFYARSTCCFWYRRRGGGTCTLCPRHSRAERVRLLQVHMQQNVVG